MYNEHKAKMRAVAAKKWKAKQAGRTPRHQKQSKTLTHGGIAKRSPESLDKKEKSGWLSQRKASVRLSQGLDTRTLVGGLERDTEKKLYTKRGQGRKLKRRVIIDALNKEKESMMMYLERLVQPLGQNRSNTWSKE